MTIEEEETPQDTDPQQAALISPLRVVGTILSLMGVVVLGVTGVATILGGDTNLPWIYAGTGLALVGWLLRRSTAP